MRRSKIPSAIALCASERRAGDEASGFVCACALRGDDRQAEPTRSGSAFWDRSAHGQEDAELFGSPGVCPITIPGGDD